MLDFAITWDWIVFAVRWLHVITAIAWIGSSFYFIALDLGLRQAAGLPEGAHGEEWQVHGGGFYHVRKYLVAPAEMPEHLTWFKWESYATWLSGFLLLGMIYYVSADLYLVDRNVLDVSAWVAILISLASLTIGWLVYDLLCKSPLGASDTGLMLLLYLLLVIMAWGYTQIFTGRAAFLHLGAFTATIMSANVFMIIIPNQKKVVTALIAGNRPDPALGKQAKQRSLHNNYLTLPVIFLMLSSHYPLAFATPYNWVIASLVFIMGVLIRHYFNTKHARKGEPHWVWLASAIVFVIIIWLSTNPIRPTDETAELPSPAAQGMMASAGFAEARDVVLSRCSMCHASQPVWEGIYWAPKNVRLETDVQIAEHAREIYLQAGVSHAMPPGNLTSITAAERLTLARWYEARGGT
ncbi:urate hydroxylase PuuD [Oricola cellulosilytica]|uniref:Cysteine desulfurase n=1 Tax=Oricola cellulosilytica TaxID=1429082 RepID=A0A4R0PC86_9HYPH|nr:urate hydroxylase PuuD [Oricola cellulosilytica]TCD15072.1 cysteine desulfurase [Oricola cellulosilytica]